MLVALETLLSLPRLRFRASEILDLLDILAIRTRFGLGEGGADTAVLDEVAHQVGEQRGAMLSGTAQFGFAYAMAHGACVFLLVSALGLVEQRGGRVDRRGFFVVVDVVLPAEQAASQILRTQGDAALEEKYLHTAVL